MKTIKNLSSTLFFLITVILANQSIASDVPSKDEITLGEFVNQAMTFGVAQSELAKLALQQSTSPEIKEFAQLIVDERITAKNDLMNIAKKKHIKIIADTELASRAEKLIPKPNNGPNFDAAYIQNQLKARQDELELFNKGALSKDPELAGFATENIPKLTHNFHLAETLAKEVVRK